MALPCSPVRIRSGYTLETLPSCPENWDHFNPQLVGEVLERLQMLAEEGMTMILVTHEVSFARDVFDWVAFFHIGVMAEINVRKHRFGDP